jgi:AbrB family looped-hinge helix DNA binding protein
MEVVNGTAIDGITDFRYYFLRMKHESNLTSKGQVTIPKDIRDALGLKPGQKVRFELDDDGNARIIQANGAEQIERRRAQIMKGVKEARRLYKAEGIDLGMDPVEYVDWIRGPAAEV